MLDEPSFGLAPRIVRDIFYIVATLKHVGMSILLGEQNVCATLRVSDYGPVLETGETVLEGPAAALAANSRVIQIFLGMSGRFRCVAP
jgi:ABC-type branched-subunit amino acid transport system ATPase component